MTSVIGTAWVTEVNATVATHASVSTRALTSAEVAALEAGGNRTSEGTWAAVKVRNEGPAFNPAAVARCVFVGAVELGTCPTLVGPALHCTLRKQQLIPI